MRRPHRPVGERLRLHSVAVGRRLPPPVRGRLRPLTGRPVDRTLRGLAAETVESFDAWGLQSALAESIAGVLEQAGIEFVRMSRSGQEWVVVDSRRAPDALRALQASSLTRTWIAAEVGRRRPRTLRSIDPDAAVPAFRLYRYLRAPSGAYVVSREICVLLEFWQPTAKGTLRPDGGEYVPHTLRPARHNRVAPYLAPAQWQDAQSRPGHRLAAQALPNILEFTGPVDAVYTWVDDNDPAWRERRAAVDPGNQGLASDALDEARTRDREEFRHSLRSLAMYAGWIRHIWIVTDGQVPAWLDLEHPRITVVAHREIFADPDALPVFNSHAIESQLHHIPGLAEHFLYLNDDFFFGRPVRPELFFHGNGLPKMMTSSIAIDLDTDTDERNGAMLAARRGREWIERTFDRTITHRMQHVPHAHLKSAVADLEALMPEDFARVARSRFRHRDDLSVPSELAHYYGYATRRTVTGGLTYQYVDAGSALGAERMGALLAERSADCFCVNDVGGSPRDGEDEELRRFLSAYFPLPSPFERIPS
ncbi:Stealth CR1 domain-containing protein [Propionicimonas sp.]|uniref:stealth family protein n=1 Tax=Propionicimonas sp. TaxID=1955623 RepID=UPI0039E2248E